MARPLGRNERRRIYFRKSDYGRFKGKGRRYHCQFVLIQWLTPFFAPINTYMEEGKGEMKWCYFRDPDGIVLELVPKVES